VELSGDLIESAAVGTCGDELDDCEQVFHKIAMIGRRWIIAPVIWLRVTTGVTVVTSGVTLVIDAEKCCLATNNEGN
jgi:hypothetical protein